MTAVFSHGDAGTDEGLWRSALAARPLVHLGDLPCVRRAVIVAPHPDDESLGSGGLAASWSAAGVEVTIVVCSDGEAVTGTAAAPGPAAVRSRRVDEVVDAVDVLSTGTKIELVRLGLPDGRLAEHADELRAQLRARLVGADVVVSPWPGDGHPDHHAVGAAVRSVADTTPRLEYPVWAWHWGTPADLAGVAAIRVPLSPSARRAKAAAIRCHRSQSEGADPILSSSVLTHFDRPEEVFVVDDATLAELAPVPRSSAAFFDALYRSTPSGDPWDFGSSRSEQRRIAQVVETLDGLDRGRFRRCLDVGCATGQMTRRLAVRADRVLGLDTSPRAVEVARRTCEGSPGVEVRTAHLPDDLTDQDRSFDLVVLSDVGYYFSVDDLGALVAELTARCSPGATLLAAHWTGASADHVLDAATTHRVIARSLESESLGWQRQVSTRLTEHLVDIWTTP